MTHHPVLLIFAALWIYGGAFMSGRNLKARVPEDLSYFWLASCLIVMMLLWPIPVLDAICGNHISDLLHETDDE